MRRSGVLSLVVCCVVGCATGGSQHAYHPEPRSALEDHTEWRDIVATPSSDTGNGAGEVEADSLSEMPAVRHRRVLAEAAPIMVASKISNLFSGGGPSPPPVASPMAPSVKSDPEKLVVEAWIDMKVDDPAKASTQIRARVEADGGRVISENVIGPENGAASAAMVLRIPPARAAGLQTWLASLGVVESRRALATDVGKTLFDQELALKNLDVTMKRLQELAAKDAPMKELIEIEQEMTRVRGQIERLKGEQRWLLDRVAFATITLTLTREGGPVEFAPHARIHPGPHLATLVLLDPAGRPRSRIGGGGTIHIKRYLTFDLDLFPAKGGDTRAVIGTLGSALYSSFLGNGRREWLNPYLGGRLGMGYLSGEKSFLAGVELGLELYKQKYIQVGIAVRGLALFRDGGTEGALQGQLGFEVPF